MLARNRAITCDGRRDDDSNTDGDVSHHDVLILSADSLAAALLGAAVELAGHTPQFPQPGEAARAALLRVRPRVVFVECDHDDACSESFIGPALMTGAKVQLFTSRRSRRDPRDLARGLGLSVATLPMDHHALADLLRELTIHVP